VTKKFVIIDHSLSNLQGHYFECSISVAEAAQKQGYEAIIISNKNFSTHLFSENIKIKIIPEFEVDWLNNYNKNYNLNKKQEFWQSVNKFFISLNPQNFTIQYTAKINYQIFKLKLHKPKARLFFEKVEGSTFRLGEWVRKDLSLIQYIPFLNTLWGLLKIT